MKTQKLIATLAALGLFSASAFAQVTVDSVVTNGLSEPYGVAVDADNNFYIADSANHEIAKVDSNTGAVTSFAGQYGESGSDDGPFFLAHFNSPQGILVATFASANLFGTHTNIVGGTNVVVANSASGLIVADTGNHSIRFINLTNGSVITLAGFSGLPGSADGVGAGARFRSPTGLTSDGNDTVYIADLGNNRIRALTLSSGNVVTVPYFSLFQPAAVAYKSATELWVADTRNHTIKLINPSSGALLTLMGSNDRNISGTADSQFGPSARFNNPRGLLWLGVAGLLIGDTANNTIRLATNFTSVSVSNYAVSTFAGTPGQSGFVNGLAASAKFSSPVGLARDVLGSAFLVADRANNAVRRIQNGPTRPPVANPQIGWVDFEQNQFGTFVTVLRTDQPFVFNNDRVIAILAELSTETFFTFGPTPPSPLEDTIPTPSRTVGVSPPFYQNGDLVAPPTMVNPQPDFTVKAIGVQDGRRPSAVVQARFQFKTANPRITGDNAASFILNDETISAEMWYTIDGSEPTNASPSIGPQFDNDVISRNLGGSNLTFKVRAFRSNYKPSDTITKTFSPTNFVPNRISFGFASGEASSAFVASAGQTFYAPITLSVIPGATMFSLQFNVTVANNSTAPAVTPGAVEFTSMLQEAVPVSLGEKLPPNLPSQWFRSILPAMFTGTNDIPGSHVLIRPTDGTAFFDLRFVDPFNNLIGVGWLERRGFTILYDTTRQDLIKYSIARDTLFDKENGRVVLGAYGFQVPASAAMGDRYLIRIGRPSATSDGVGAPGSDVFIETPTNAAITSITNVTVGVQKYLVGDAAPFRWLNAGDFGNASLLNDDVMQVFETAVYDYGFLVPPVNDPPVGSDLFDAMDSCCGQGITNGAVVVASGSTVDDPSIFDGSDRNIDYYPFGDGKLDIADVYVTFRRSLDPCLTWWQRYHSPSGLSAETVPNQFRSDTNECPPVPFIPPPPPPAGEAPAVTFIAGDAIASAGQTLQIPIIAQIRGTHPLHLLMLNLAVQPLDGSPPLAQAVQFTPVAGLGSPTLTSSHGPSRFIAAWLNNGNAGVSGNSLLGTLQVTLPASATGNAAYAIQFAHASASPNGVASFPRQTQTGLITLSDRSVSSQNDGISDSWRLRHFGTVGNILSAATADADGDGVSNWNEYKAGTNPNDRGSRLALTGKRGGSQNFTIRWPSVANKHYVIERAATLYGPTWSPISTNVGTGWDMEFQDTSAAGNIRFYRVRVTE